MHRLVILHQQLGSMKSSGSRVGTKLNQKGANSLKDGSNKYGFYNYVHK